MSQNKAKLEYLIVDFPEESKNGDISMALISSTWVFEENSSLFCYWPAYLRSTLSRERVVQNHTPLLTYKCVKCMVVVKYTSDDYYKASLKLKKMEEESEFSSATDIEVPTNPKSYKLNRKLDFVYSEGSDDEINCIPVPPRFPKDASHNYNIKRTTVCDNQNDNTSQQTEPNQPSIKYNIKSAPVFDSTSRQQSQPTEQGPNYTMKSTLLDNPSQQTEREIDDKNCQCEKNSKILERLLRDIQTIKLDIKTVLKEVNNNKITEFQQLDGQLCFSEYEDFLNFNNKLLDDDYFNKMQSSISLLGGRDLNDTAKKIVSLLLSHDLALKMNWIGANDKGGFSKATNILKLIYGAVRRNPATSNATNSEIDKSIRNWIKNAPDRAGGRAQRQKSKHVNK